MSDGSPLASLLLIAGLSLLPFFVAMTTSYLKFAVVLSILRNAIGTPQIPPTIVVTGLAMIMTAYVMAPTAIESYKLATTGQPAATSAEKSKSLLSAASARALVSAGDRAKEPLRRFLTRNSSPRDQAMFVSMAKRMWPESASRSVDRNHFMVAIPAFVIGQLALAFKIGFLLFIPFLVIDLLVANVLLSLGMHMLSPVTVSLPFKLLMFVLVDGWSLLTQGLINSYG